MKGIEGNERKKERKTKKKNETGGRKAKGQVIPGKYRFPDRT